MSSHRSRGLPGRECLALDFLKTFRNECGTSQQRLQGLYRK
jgi:hypothetical protein